jgi:hypothetical protein
LKKVAAMLLGRCDLMASTSSGVSTHSVAREVWVLFACSNEKK